MEKEKFINHPYTVTFSDFIKVIKRSSQKIFIISILFGILGALFAMNKHPSYQIKASFKERDLAKSNLDSSSIGVLFGGNNSEKQAEATTWMSSHNYLKELVKNMSLHGTITPKNQSFFQRIERMKENLIVELAYLLRKKTPGITDKPYYYFLTEVSYDKETPSSFDVTFLENDRYLVQDSFGHRIGNGEIGKNFSFGDISFTINRNEKVDPKENLFKINLSSPDASAKELSSLIKFENSTKDKELILLEAYYPDRHIGANLINNLMKIYKKNKAKEQQRISQEQLYYLENKQSQAGILLQEALSAYAAEQSQDVLNNGFLTSDKALEFLAASQQEQHRRLLAIDLEIKRLNKVLAEGYVHYDRYHADGDPAIINNLLMEIRKLNQQQDSIKLSLQDSKTNLENEKEFTGIDLSIARELFIHYNHELNQTEALTIKLKWVLENLQDPKFELNSLMSELTDPISSKIITDYSALLLKLQDLHNLSNKEQERIKEELLRQRAFFEMHVKQTLQISELTIDLLKSKTNSLNRVTLTLIQQQIVLLEKQLKNYISDRIQNLIHESQVIDDHLKKLTKDMALIPQKKISEQLVQQKLDQIRDFGREIAHIVESKNITDNLEIVQSTTVDHAIAPLFPKYPKILLTTFLGSLFGLFLSSVYLFCKDAYNGLQASEENLEEINLHVSGTLSKKFSNEKNGQLQDRDLAVIRKISNQLVYTNQNNVLIIGAENAFLAKQLIMLIHKKGMRPFYLPLNFDKIDRHGEKGLLQYLEGHIDYPDLYKEDYYETLYIGGISRYSTELICSERFKALLKNLCEQYECVVAYSNTKPTSAEAESIIPLFNNICVNLKEETIENLEVIRILEKQTTKKFTFVFNS